ncbi:alpha/beta hydrolase [Sporosarcina sp. BI001-red]|uniref:alpha/beta fold hydrolase n=1 Tax=Sporosarcina sp. BI001-red TaxID=2282866 RepID=UPI000E267854|nr:alpha/beta hydrolase [Sporosarcina sp. BI001-red]REB07080.1 alpha/beta hydrolase [Sporosarcina sp. BI001-red]
MESGYYEWGNRNKPTLVFLHGMGSAGLSFGELAQLILNDYHVVSFDLPGHGGKAPLPNEEDYSPENLAQRLSKSIKALGLTEIFLVGHSWGAHLALYVAGHSPEMVKGLILLDGGYFQQDSDGDSLAQQLKNVDTFTEQVRYASWEEFLKSEKGDSPRWSKEIEAGRLAQVTEIDGEIRLAISPFTAKAVIKGTYQQQTATIFPKVLSPVLLMRSTLPIEVEDDRRTAIEYLVRKIPQVEVYAIPNTSHDIYRDAPETIACKINEWINRKL